MRASFLLKAFWVSLFVVPLAATLAWIAGGEASSTLVLRLLFAATVVVEVGALRQTIVTRRLFAKSDAGYLTWTLTSAFLLVRLVAEARLLTLTFNLVSAPHPIEQASAGIFFYVIWLRYLYTVSDVLFVGALITTIKAYRGTGLKFEIIGRDYVYIALVWFMPLTTLVFRSQLGLAGITASDPYILGYRLTAVFVGAAIATLCLVVRRYVVQMGRGAVGRVWNSVAVAGIARDMSFLALAVLGRNWGRAAAFGEQYLLWIFAACWLLAALYQQALVPARRPVPAPEPAEART